MRFALSLAALVALSAAARAEDLVWHLNNGEDGGGTLAVLERSELDSPEPQWRFSLNCYPGEAWEMTVGGVDPKKLGAAIAAGEAVTFGFLVDGAPSDGMLSQFFPDIRFGLMMGEWEYVAPIDPDLLREMGAASGLTVTGTGIELTLPPEGIFEGIEAFRKRCAELDTR
jgi:hypothetical protein